MFRALVLGIVQGLTEFVPVSSSAHLVLVPYVLSWNVAHPVPGIPAVTFDVAVHLGTLLALLAYFWRDLLGFVSGTVRTLRKNGDDDDRANARLLWLLAVASVPAAIAGALFQSYFDRSFEQPQIVALELLITAALLVGADAIEARRSRTREIGTIGVVDAIVMGVMQAVAILPGVSRSGATISGGMARGLTKEAAARFSFLLAIPAIAGAGLLKARDLSEVGSLGTLLVGTAAAAVVGFISIAWLLRYLKTHRLRPFAIYCVFAALMSLYYWSQVK